MGCAELVKIFVFTYNLIFGIVGLTLISIATFYKYHLTKFTDAIPSQYDSVELAPMLTIVVGATIFVISFFGCFGAYKHSSFLLTIYAVILLAIFIGQIAIGVYTFVQIDNEHDFESQVNRTIEKTFNGYNRTKGNTELVDVIQQELRCCGTNGSHYWKDVPNSCCATMNDCPKSAFERGCEAAFYDFLYKSLKIIGITVLILSATEVIGSTLSLCLANSIRNEERKYRYRHY